MTARKHAELIKAWADGAEIQYYSMDCEWKDVDNPQWVESSQYRIKPVPKADYVKHGLIDFHSRDRDIRGLSAKVTFSGETGEAKKVEIVK